MSDQSIRDTGATSVQPTVSNGWLVAWLGATAVSQIGNRIYMLAIPWLVMSITGSVLHMNAVWAVEVLPYVVVSPFLGALIDRLDRRLVLVVSEFGQALLIALLPVLAAFGMLELWHLYVVGFLTNVFGSAYNLVADFSVIPRLASGPRLVRANSLYFAVLNLATVVGPSLGGGIIAWLGSPTAIALDSLSFVATGIVAWLLPIDLKPVHDGQATTFRSVTDGFKEGFSYLVRDRVLVSLAASIALVNVAASALFTTFTYYLGTELHVVPEIVGIGYGLSGLFALAGSLVAPYFLNRFHLGRLILVWTGLEMVALFIMGATRLWPIALLGFSLDSMIDSIRNITTFTIRQRVIPDRLMGRVNGSFRAILVSAFPISGAVMGYVTDRVGGQWAFVTAGVLMGMAGLVILGSPITKAPIGSVQRESHV